MMSKVLPLAALAALALQPVHLQAQPTAPAFEVASIRPHAGPLRTIMGLTISGPRITMEGYNIPLLIMEAYHLKTISQISLAALRGQDELLNVYYDIVARAPGDGVLARDESRKMLQNLLAERFKLSVHRERKDRPVYALVLGKNGPKLNEATGNAKCAVNVRPATGGQSYSFANCTIDALVDILSNGLVDRPVIDRTQMTGKYNFRIVAKPDFMSSSQPDLADLSPFTAIEDLGLKLQMQTTPMARVAVDHVTKPTEN